MGGDSAVVAGSTHFRTPLMAPSIGTRMRNASTGTATPAPTNSSAMRRHKRTSHAAVGATHGTWPSSDGTSFRGVCCRAQSMMRSSGQACLSEHVRAECAADDRCGPLTMVTPGLSGHGRGDPVNVHCGFSFDPSWAESLWGCPWGHLVGVTGGSARAVATPKRFGPGRDRTLITTNPSP